MVNTERVPSGRVAAKRAALRSRIVDTALKAFSTQGFENTRIMDIAEQLEMTGPALYHYFSTKDQLLFACLDHILDQLLDDATRAAAAPGSPRERLANVVRVQIETEFKYGSTAPLINAHLYGPKYLTDMVAEDKQEFLRRKQRALIQIYRTLIEEGMKTGEFGQLDVKIAAFNVLAIIQYSGVWYRPKKGRKSSDVIDAQVDSVMGLLGARDVRKKSVTAARLPRTVGGGK